MAQSRSGQARATVPPARCGRAPSLCGLLFVLLIVLLSGRPAAAQVLRLGAELAVPAGSGGAHLPEDRSLGEFAQVLLEAQGAPLTLEGARDRLARGRFRPAGTSVPHFGFDKNGAWLHLALSNPTGRALAYRFYAGESWVDRVDVYLVAEGQPVGRWHAGDERAPGAELRAGLGYAFDLSVPAGASELFVRVASIDPAALPVRLVPMAQVGTVEGAARQWLGLFHGGLLALVCTFALLYAVLRERLHLRYVALVAAFLWLSLCYSGLASEWLWPTSPVAQRFAIPFAMVLFAWAGLTFARDFLGLSTWWSRADRVVAGGAWAAVAAMLLCIATDAHLPAIGLAFVVVAVGLLAMLGLGVMAWRRSREQARLFLAAVGLGTAGVLCTALAVVGALPLNDFTFHALEAGVTLEATVWALAMGLRLRRQQHDNTRAFALAQRDPLTGLDNRRGFLDRALPIWSTAARQSRPLSAILLDIDHFKHINDRHGHKAGDRLLIEVADRLTSACRAGDVVARWGGEEFVLLLPETGCEQAGLLAERLRGICSASPAMIGDGHRVAFTASFGVAVCERSTSLQALLKAADHALYAAKDGGRDRVVVASLPPPMS